MSHLKLVEQAPDQDIVETLEDLLVMAREGNLPGFAYVALHKGAGYSADVLGSVHQHPLFTIGVCDALKAEVVLKTRKTP